MKDPVPPNEELYSQIYYTDNDYVRGIVYGLSINK